MLSAIIDLFWQILIAYAVICLIRRKFGPEKAAKSEPRKRPELSDEQREKIVKAILEESLLQNDSAYDSLMNSGEAKYPAADACKCSGHDFDLQYGTKSWLKAWDSALSTWFDCQSTYIGDGFFRVYGKEA